MLLPRAVALRHRRARWMLEQGPDRRPRRCSATSSVRGLTAAAPDVALDHARDIVAVRAGPRHPRARRRCRPRSPPPSTLEPSPNWIYIWGHWPVIIATMVWLGWHHREVFVRLRDAMLISGGLGHGRLRHLPGGAAAAGRTSAWSTP